LCLEALDERLLPSHSPFNPGVLAAHNPFAQYTPAEIRMGAELNIQPLQSMQLDPAPNLMGPMQRGSKIDLGQGTLTIENEFFNVQSQVWQFTGHFESSAHIVLPLGIPVSDDIGPVAVTGQISRWPTSSGSAVFINGSTVSYYTSSISFQGAGDGTVGSSMLPDHQQVSFSGSVLSVWLQNQPTAIGVSGSVDIIDHVTGIPGFGNRDFDSGQTPVPGTPWIGMNWASIQYLT
jgi:hypothetical protein